MGSLERFGKCERVVSYGLRVTRYRLHVTSDSFGFRIWYLLFGTCIFVFQIIAARGKVESSGQSLCPTVI
jgi:hypothetical protein